MPLYRHTQIGHTTRWALRAAALLCAGGMWASVHFGGADAGLALGFAGGALLVFGACLLLFGSLTVSVDERRIELRFGPGWPRFGWKVADVRAVRAVRNPWWHGWGIHRTSRGWLFNVSGFEAVELELATGRKVRIGTDEPLELVEAIEAARAR